MVGTCAIRGAGEIAVTRWARIGDHRASPLGAILSGIGLFVLLVAFLPMPRIPWFDTVYFVAQLRGKTPSDALLFFRAYNGYARPVRALEWWIAIQIFGASPLAYHLANVFSVSLATALIVWFVSRLTGSFRSALIVGFCWAMSYATIYPLLHFSYALNLSLAFCGLGASLFAKTSWGRACGVLGLWMGALGHDVLLQFIVLPWAYSRWVRPLPKWIIWAPFAILPLWYFLKGTGSAGTYESSAIEHMSRVLVAIWTAGLPAEGLRVLGLADSHLHLRDALLHPAVLAGLLLLGMPMLALCYARAQFLFFWILVGALPLLLPVGTPESYHLAPMLPAVFLLWVSAWKNIPVTRRGGKRAILLCACISAVVVWLPLQAVARWHTFQDVRVLSTVAKGLLDRGYDNAIIHHLPIQIGGHYGFWPGLPARGACYVDPVWLSNRTERLTQDTLSEGRRFLQHQTMHNQTNGILALCQSTEMAARNIDLAE